MKERTGRGQAEVNVIEKKVNQSEIMGAELNVMRDMSKVLNKRLASMNDEKQDD